MPFKATVSGKELDQAFNGSPAKGKHYIGLLRLDSSSQLFAWSVAKQVAIPWNGSVPASAPIGSNPDLLLYEVDPTTSKIDPSLIMTLSPKDDIWTDGAPSHL